MTQAAEQIASQFANANKNKIEYGNAYYWVTVYGAKGDGVTNDTTKIQSAIDAANAAGGGVVFFPEGTYKVSTFNVKSNVWLLGAGPQSVIDLIDDGTLTSTFVYLNTVTNVKISDLAIMQSNATGRTSLYGVLKGDSADDVIIQNVHFGKASSTAIHTSDCENWLIQGCKVRDTYADGFHISRGSKRFRIIGNDFKNTGDDAIGIIGYIDTDNWPMCEDITIIGNTVYDSEQRGIVVNGGRHVVIEGNTIQKTLKAGINIGTGENIHNNALIVISNNIITDTGNGAIADTSGIYAGYCRFLTVSNNQVEDSQGDGITLFPLAKDVTINDNIFSRCTRGVFADQLKSSDANVISELCTAFGDTSTEIGFSNIAIQGNTIRRMRVDGINIDGESSLSVLDIRIYDNIMYENNIDNVVARNIFLNYCNNCFIFNNILRHGVNSIVNIGQANSSNVYISKVIDNGALQTDTISTKYSSKTVSFSAPFLSVPNVSLTGDTTNSDGYTFHIENLTMTGFTAVAVKDDGTSAISGIWFHYIAVASS